MSNYSQIVLYGPKDSLSHGDPNKLIKGVQLDAELAAIAVAIATKYDPSTLTSISPTWTNVHNFSAGLAVSGGTVNIGARNTIGRGISLVNYVTSSDGKASNATPAVDANLAVALGVGAYSFEFYIPLTVTTAGGIQFKPNYDGTFSTGTYGCYGVSAAVFFSSATRNVNVISQFGNAITGDWFRIVGSIVTTSSGTFSLSWAQNASNATATTIGIGAYVSATQLS